MLGSEKVDDNPKPQVTLQVMGPRIRVKYSNADQEGHHRSKENLMDEDYWVSVRSTFVFPVGWATRHGCLLKVWVRSESRPKWLMLVR